MLGRLFHLTIDAALLSTSLAGIRRSTGLALDMDRIKNEEVRSIVARYLGFGEWAMDTSVAFLGTSGWFRRER
ncbi:MAG: hypothetical protein DHS80DRAFT_17264 [Piptocephalis tieghemiana]|nr:MAG: hypothetical protein DHS80DRAFT_17264 [Piptocephalis tieghemiana]